MTHVARKRFGQHFLIDDAVIADIVAAIDPQPGQRLVEIGPGLGALTWPLLARAGQLTVIELDRDLAARLRREPALDVVESDVLTVDLAVLAKRRGGTLRVVGNLPYNVSSPILFHLLSAARQLVDQHLMLQREVARRIVAAPGGRDYGRLSVMLQWRYLALPLLDVPPKAFAPPPKVQSAVLRMVPRADPVPVDPVRLERLVQVAFSQRRKLLRHTLGRYLDAEGFAGSFDLHRRAEEVPVGEYVGTALALG